ncbi:MAG TPA: adenylate/guanylate cyclase domain-containing protein, partial [Planctomycetota bacterium]|nr:adenylate/guanylate cyclase domain-containing protein [Planctomycetota bacterium]
SGKVLQDIGDGYFLSFSSVGHAVAAALLFQYLMTKEAWPHPFTSRVGIHLGEVEEGHSQVTGQADFISSAIDQASRTMSLAVGGQILLTRTVFDSARHAVREHPPVGADAPAPALAWMSHGSYLFKGCTDPVDVFEVGAKGVAPLTPPPDSEKAKRAMLPTTPVIAATGETQVATRPASRRTLLKAAAVGIPAVALAGAGYVVFGSRPDPMAESRRKAIEQKVANLKAQPPQPAPPPANVKEVDRIVLADLGAFDVLYDSRVVDLRAWKEVPQDAMSERLSAVHMRRNVQLVKNAPVDVFEMQARTSGLAVDLSCADPYPSAVEAQKGESFVAQERMKVRKVSIDVSKIEVGREFSLNLQVTYWNSMQTESEQWFGMIGYPKSIMTSLLMVFPPSKPFKEHRLTVARTEKDVSTEFTGPRSVYRGDARDWICWEVAGPEPGRVYRLHWKW